ncbi:hypothetical protein ONZ45_g5122 [Pleurotus djamor]|nr:hypothetical protein ONZ45_g5122 [Pleurotus djamor]
MISALLFTISHNFILAVAATLFTYITLRAIYNLFFSPLSAIPGPWYAAVSDLWITYHVLRLEQCKTVQALFEEYGPVVRIGPNKVAFCDMSSTRSVYSVHKFDKSPYYKSLLTNDNDHAMTTLGHSAHSIRRKGYAPHYAPANLARFQPEMHDITHELIDTLESLKGKSVLECLATFRHFMVDVVVMSSYGYRHGALRRWASGVEDVLSDAVGDFPKRGILRSAVPTWAWNLVCRIPNERWRKLCRSDKIMAEFATQQVYNMRAQVNAGSPVDTERPPMLQRLLQYKYSTTNQMMPDLDIVSECMGHMVAASDTTSTSLSYFFWELSRRPDIVQKLRAELDEVMPDSKRIPDISVLQSLPYLNAFVKEGLRLYGAAPSLLERVVPTPSKNCEPFELLGYALPPGTIVSTQAWSMHRDASVFPSPETFLPERWLESTTSPEDLALMTQHMMPFGTGSRVCGGQNLAQVIMRVAVAAIARNFDVLAPSETNEKTMEMKDSFVIFPASMECKLSFLPRK